MASGASELFRQSENAQPAAVEAAVEVLRAGQEEAHAVLLNRTVRALSRSVAALDRDEALTAAAAGSDLEALVTAIEDALGRSGGDNDNSYARVRMRGLLARRRLLEAEGGVVSAETAAQILGVSRQVIQKRRLRGRLLALPVGDRAFGYPAWQFGDDGRVIPGLEDVLAALAGHDPWMQLAFFLGPDARLDGSTPLEALHRDDVAAGVAAAESFGEHGAD
jgi:hypothetical protein